MGKNDTGPSAETKAALLEKRVTDLEDWKRDEKARSKKINWAVFMTFIASVGFILSKAWEQIWK